VTSADAIAVEARDGAASAPSGLDGWLLPAYALLLPVLAWSSGYSPYAIPKVALNLVVLGPGLVALALLIRDRDRAAWWAGGFLAVAALATIVADEALMSLTGSYSLLNGWGLFAVGTGVWALGRRAPGVTGRVEIALVAGATVNAAAAWIAASARPDYVLLKLVEGRPTGLMPNPVLLGALAAAAIWVVLARTARAGEIGTSVVLVGVLFGAIELSGTRSAEVVAGVTVLWFAVRWLRAGSPARALVVVVMAAGGFLLAQLPPDTGVQGSTRLTGDAFSGLSTRVESWGDALDAVGERPVLGYGPGRTYVALESRRSAAIARHETPDLLYYDAHDVVVEVLTTTGVLGLLAFGGWMWTAVRGARGPLLGFAGVGAAMMLAEPVSHSFAPLVLLALGLASAHARPPPRPAAGSWPRVVSAGLAAVGLVAGVALLAGDASYLDSARESTVSSLDGARDFWPPWPDVALRDSQLLALRAQQTGSPADQRAALAAAREARRRDPASPLAWEQIGRLEALWGSPARAHAAYLGALERNPWSSRALEALFVEARGAGDRAAAARYRRALCDVRLISCR
jgi:hypothetical protein